LVQYDANIVLNPRAASVPMRSFHVRIWGLCDAGEFTTACNTGVFNVSMSLKTWGYTRSAFPSVIRITVGCVVEHYGLADTIGLGSTFLLCGLAPIEALASTWELRLACVEGHSIVACCTCQLAIFGMLQRSGAREAPPIGFERAWQLRRRRR
jgi:hypothetical protein